jgi:hypothetical protein
MKADYFGDLLHSVPGVPGKENQSGDGRKPHGSKVSPVSPLSPVEKTTSVPTTCQGCPALELLDVAGVMVAGCVKTLPSASPWREEWRKIPEGLTTCTLVAH